MGNAPGKVPPGYICKLGVKPGGGLGPPVGCCVLKALGVNALLQGKLYGLLKLNAI